MVHVGGRGGGITGVCGRLKYSSDEMSRQNLVRNPEVWRPCDRTRLRWDETSI